MFLNLQRSHFYQIDAIDAPSAFFQHLGLLLKSRDTLVVGCYDARDDIYNFLVNVGTISSRHRLQSTFDVMRPDYPRGHAFHIPATEENLVALVQLVLTASSFKEYCDHIAGYSEEAPLFSYHDAFRSPLYISSAIPEDKVREFSAVVSTTGYKIQTEQGAAANS